jgi:hypothetical protein
MIATVDRKRRLARLSRSEVIWVKGEAAFAPRRGRRATVLPEEEAEGNGRRGSREKRQCPVCGLFFTPTRPEQRYCGPLCREAAIEAGEVEEEAPTEGAVAENHPRKPLHMFPSHAPERRGVVEAGLLYPPAGQAGASEEIPEVEGEAFPEAPARRVTDPEEIRQLLQKVLNGAIKVLAGPGTEPCEREFYCGFTAEDRDAQVGCFIPKLIRRLLVLYSKGLFVPTALFLWEGRGGPALVGVEGTVAARLIGIRGWTGRTSRAEEAVGVVSERGGAS